MRLVFFGTSAFAVPSLESLVGAGHEVVLCVTQPDRPKGRGLKLEASPVKQAAERLGVPLAQPERPTASLCDGLRPDAGAVAAYGSILREDLLRVLVHGMLGVHPSLLPAYRGAAPINRAILNGDADTGVTIYRLNAAMDAGDLLLQERVAIDPDEDAVALGQRLAQLGAVLLCRGLEQLATGAASFRPQPAHQASLAPKLSKDEGRLTWSASAAAIHRQVRGLMPWPGVTAAWQGQPVKLWSVSPTDGRGEPGAVLNIGGEGITIAAGAGALLVREVQPAGRRRMSGAEFARGYDVRTGSRFGEPNA